MKKILLCVLVALCVMASVQPVLADQAEDYKRQCESVRYEDVARNPDKYAGRNITFAGRVSLIYPDESFRIAQDGGRDFWYAEYMRKQGEGRILKGDYIKVYGVCKGIYNWTGDPFIQIRYYEILD